MSEVVQARYEAEVRWTTHAVAHVRAESWGSLGFGQGWACARDHLPTIADQVVKVRSQRARFHGEGPNGDHVASDLGYRVLGVAERADAFHDAQPSFIQEMVAGYVAGVNLAVAQIGDEWELPAWCRGAPWIRPISESDLYGHLVDMVLMASGRNLAGMIGRAEAPGPDGPAPPSPSAALGPSYASNGWAFGRAATANGRGVVVANPHFPWGGEGRFWECHLTIPGQIDVYGGCLLGAPGVYIGFNDDVAWAHTFSAGFRFGLYRIDLVSGSPTRYRFGDAEREMTPETHAVDVLADDGAVSSVERTLWRSHHGPMVNLPLLGWGLDQAFTYRDANIDNTTFLAQFLAMDQASDMASFQAAFAETQGMPWANTLAADRDGAAWYCDASATPNLSPDAQARFRDRVETDLVAALLAQNRVALLDGSDPDDEWVDVPGARDPGLVPWTAMPQVARDDFVFNGNDSHWMTHPDELLEGHSPLHGLERTARTLRTRQNALVCAELAAAGAVDADAALEALFANRSLTADLLLDDVVARCRAAGSVVHDGDPIDVAAAAEILAAWDRAVSLPSVGAALWRETMAAFSRDEWRSAGRLFAVAFDPSDPVHTPRDLAPPGADGVDHAVAAVAAAVAALTLAGVAADAPLGDVQWAQRGEHRVAVHGGGEGDGVLNVLAPIGALPDNSIEPPVPDAAPIDGRSTITGLRVGGYRVSYGTSFVLAVEFGDDGPRAKAVLAYGQSGDPASVHHRDGTEAYRDMAMRDVCFTDTQIAADPHLRARTITSA